MAKLINAVRPFVIASRHLITSFSHNRQASAAIVALRASTKHPAHKLLKKSKQGTNDVESVRTFEGWHSAISRRQLAPLSRVKIREGVKNGWRYLEAIYFGFTAGVLVVAGLEYLHGNKAGKDVKGN